MAGEIIWKSDYALKIGFSVRTLAHWIHDNPKVYQVFVEKVKYCKNQKYFTQKQIKLIEDLFCV